MAKSSPPRTSRSNKKSGVSSPATPKKKAATAGWVQPPALSSGAGPDAAAIRLFEHAVTRLQRHDYRKALVQFEQLLDEFPGERTLLERARVYATLCQRELTRADEGTPATVEERLTAATAALNDREEQRAEQLVSQVIKEAPSHELGHYLAAVVHARRGRTAAALDALRRAVDLSPEVRAQALHDVDFEILRGHDSFEEIIAELPAQSGTRRGSEPLSGR